MCVVYGMFTILRTGFAPTYNMHRLIVVILHEFTCVHETKVVMFIFIIVRERNVLRRARLNNIVCATRK